jgi:uncharacterized membrane protein YfcA
MIALILSALAVLAAGFSGYFIKDLVAHRKALEPHTKITITAGIGLLVNFLDTLGIGSFAPLTALLRGFKQIRDRVIPGTLNVSCAVPVVAEAFIFISIIEVDAPTLLILILTAVCGTVIGAGLVAKLPERRVQLVMGAALLTTAFFMFAGRMGWISGLGTGTAIGLAGFKLAFAAAVNFLLGALQAAGIGMYAPSMALVYSLGMSPRVAFPIMMASSAFTLPPAAMRFIKAGAYNRKAALAVTLSGVVGVLIAAYIVKSLPLNALTWLVMAVILFTALDLLSRAARGASALSSPETNAGP